jgi:hypothetical protein
MDLVSEQEAVLANVEPGQFHVQFDVLLALLVLVSGVAQV